MEQKYKAHFMDMNSNDEIIHHVIVNKSQKNLLDFLFKNELLPDWLKVEYIPEKNDYADLT
jgi:hypothetical protein